MSKEFTHAYCDLCETIQEVMREELRGEDTSGRFEGGDILCIVCGSLLLTVYAPKVQESLAKPPYLLEGTTDFIHAYCDHCETIQPVKREELERDDLSGKFQRGDIICIECGSLLLAVYVPKDPESLPKATSILHYKNT